MGCTLDDPSFSLGKVYLVFNTHSLLSTVPVGAILFLCTSFLYFERFVARQVPSAVLSFFFMGEPPLGSQVNYWCPQNKLVHGISGDLMFLWTNWSHSRTHCAILNLPQGKKTLYTEFINETTCYLSIYRISWSTRIYSRCPS